MSLTAADYHKLEEKAVAIREDIIKMLVEAGSGHSAGPLGMADVFTALYFNVLKHDPKKPDWDERDMLVLSNGHICPVLYATLAHAGYFPISELKTLRKLGTRLQGHPHRGALPGIETTSGPLGSGLSQACGMAYGLRMDNSKMDIYIEFNPTKLTQNSFNVIQKLSEIITDCGQPGEYEIDIFRITINNLNTYEHELIVCNKD